MNGSIREKRDSCTRKVGKNLGSRKHGKNSHSYKTPTPPASYSPQIKFSYIFIPFVLQNPYLFRSYLVLVSLFALDKDCPLNFPLCSVKIILSEYLTIFWTYILVISSPVSTKILLENVARKYFQCQWVVLEPVIIQQVLPYELRWVWLCIINSWRVGCGKKIWKKHSCSKKKKIPARVYVAKNFSANTSGEKNLTRKKFPNHPLPLKNKMVCL